LRVCVCVCRFDNKAKERDRETKFTYKRRVYSAQCELKELR